MTGKNRSGRRTTHFEPFPLPLDICLTIFSQLTIRDLLSLRQTCRTFFEITQLRSLWHLVLRVQIIQKDIPVPGLAGRSIDALSSRDLEYLVRRSICLRRNWTSALPATTVQVDFSPLTDTAKFSHGLQFLPGRSSRWLLSLSARTLSTLRTSVQCWDIEVSPPVCVAHYCVGDLPSFALNTDPSSLAVLALHLRGNNNQFCTKIFKFNPSPREPALGFTEMATIPKPFVTLHLFSGSIMISQEQSGRLVYWDVRSPNIEAELQGIPPYQFGTCHTAMLVDDCAIIIRVCFLEIYSLASFRAARDRSCVLRPLARYEFPWKIDRVCLTKQATWDPTPYPPIQFLIRFADHSPWPSNILHYGTIHPNTRYTRSRIPSANNSPYLIHPTVISTIAAPVRLFARWSMALGEYGSAVWIDSHTEDYRGPNSDCQRLAGAYLLEGNEDDSSPRMRTADSVYRFADTGDWTHLAVDEREGRIALGTKNGMISLFRY